MPFPAGCHLPAASLRCVAFMWLVHQGVFLWRDESKILRAVIELVAVCMMNMFMGFKYPTKFRSHHGSMFKLPSAIRYDHPITAHRNVRPPASPLWMFATALI